MTDGTDGVFGFVAGLYAAALVAPAAAIGVALGVTTDPGVLFFVLLGTVTVVAVSVGWLAREESVAVCLGEMWWVWLLAVLPFGYAASLAVGEEIPASGAVVGLSIVGMAAGFVSGLGLAVAAQNRHAKAALADAEELVRFTAPAPERDRRAVNRAVIVLFAAGALSLVGSVVLGSDPLRWLFQLLVPVGAGMYGAVSDRNVVVSGAGLVVGNPAHKRFRSWSAYESFSVDEEAIVVRRAGWSAWGLWDLRRDAGDVDVTEVATALGRFLPRRE